MTKYFVSMRLGDKNGPTLAGGHFEGHDITEARAKAQAQFFDPPDFSLATDEPTLDFLHAVARNQHRANEIGFCLIARKSTAAP